MSQTLQHEINIECARRSSNPNTLNVFLFLRNIEICIAFEWRINQLSLDACGFNRKSRPRVIKLARRGARADFRRKSARDEGKIARDQFSIANNHEIIGIPRIRRDGNRIAILRFIRNLIH